MSILDSSCLQEKSIIVKSPHRYLSDVLDDLPDNVYLNKTSTGCGGSTLCLTNKVNYVLVVPYRSAIQNKTSQHDNVFGVQGGVTEFDIENYLIKSSGSLVAYKIMTTYDSLYKVYNVLNKLNLLKEFKLCADEAHCLVSLAKIKGKCFNYFYKVFKDFKSFVFLTATPNDSTLLPAPIKDVEFVRVQWECAEKVDITEQRVKDSRECNKYVIEICKQHILGEVDGNAYIYYNSVNEIISVISKLKQMPEFNQDNVNIFCAETGENDLKIRNRIGNRFLGGSFNDCKKINFLTSANYESCDIYDKHGHTYIIVSSKRNSTALTNHILVPQICGRLRNSVYKNKAKMIVCGFNDDIYNVDDTSFDKVLDAMKSEAEYMIARSLKTLDDGFIDTFNKDLVSFESNPFIIVNDDMIPELNDGAFLSEKQVHKAYNSYISTIMPIDDNTTIDIANTTRVRDDNLIKVSDVSQLLVNKKVDYCRIMMQYIKSIETNNQVIKSAIEQKSEIHKLHVSVLGVDRIKSIGFNKTKITNAYNMKCKFNDKSLEIRYHLNDIKVGNKYLSSEILKSLQKAYSCCGITKSPRIQDINNYFSVEKVMMVSKEDSKRKNGYLIMGDLYK